MCITDSVGACKLGKHIILEITEVGCLQNILSNVSCQQKYSANPMESMQAAAEQGREGVGEVVNV